MMGIPRGSFEEALRLLTTADWLAPGFCCELFGSRLMICGITFSEFRLAANRTLPIAGNCPPRVATCARGGQLRRGAVYSELAVHSLSVVDLRLLTWPSQKA